MKAIYYILTENRHNQILIFEKYEDARNWALKCTNWSEQELVLNIKKSVRIGDNMQSIFAQ